MEGNKKIQSDFQLLHGKGYSPWSNLVLGALQKGTSAIVEVFWDIPSSYCLLGFDACVVHQSSVVFSHSHATNWSEDQLHPLQATIEPPVVP